MSDWTRIADDAIEATFGPGGRLHLLRPNDDQHCVAWVEDGYNEDNARRVVAIGAGSDHGEACRMLVRVCYRDDHRLTTQETAIVLGVSDSRVRQMALANQITEAEAGSEGRPARFEPAEVWRLVESRMLPSTRSSVCGMHTADHRWTGGIDDDPNQRATARGRD